MHIITVRCSQCSHPYVAHITPSNYDKLKSMDPKPLTPQCIDCFGMKIYAPPDVKAWIISRLKAFPYEIIP